MIGGADAGLLGELHPGRADGLRSARRARRRDGTGRGGAAGGVGRGADPWRRYQASRRLYEDVAVVVDEGTPAGAGGRTHRQTGGKLLVDVRLFDIYRWRAGAAGKKSLPMR